MRPQVCRWDPALDRILTQMGAGFPGSDPLYPGTQQPHPCFLEKTYSGSWTRNNLRMAGIAIAYRGVFCAQAVKISYLHHLI